MRSRLRQLGLVVMALALGSLAISRNPMRPQAATVAPLDGGQGEPVAVVSQVPALLPVSGPAPGPRFGAQSFTSRLLGRQVPYLVFLPPGYDNEPVRRYPVLYMLHGMGGSYTEWYGYGLFEAAARLMTGKEIPPFIIVLPQGDFDYWVDHAGGLPWGRYTAEEVVTEVDSRFRTLADRRSRAIGGHSMGGHGALQLAMNYPERFAIAGAHSPTLRAHGDAPEYFGDAAFHAAHDPASLVRAHPEAARRLTVYLDVGEADGWLPVVAAFRDLLAETGVNTTWQTFPGGHESPYWAANVEAYLRWYGQAFAEMGGER